MLTIEVENEIRQVVCDILEINVEDVSDDENLVQEYGADSMMALEIFALIEKKLKIIIPEKELVNMATLNGIKEVAERYMI